MGFLYLLYLFFFLFFFYLRILTRIRMLHPKRNSVVIILFTKCLYPLITLKQNLGFHIWIFWLCTIVAGALWCRLQDYWCGNIGCFFSLLYWNHQEILSENKYCQNIGVVQKRIPQKFAKMITQGKKIKKQRTKLKIRWQNNSTGTQTQLQNAKSVQNGIKTEKQQNDWQQTGWTNLDLGLILPLPTSACVIQGTSFEKQLQSFFPVTWDFSLFKIFLEEKEIWDSLW